MKRLDAGMRAHLAADREDAQQDMEEVRSEEIDDAVPQVSDVADAGVFASTTAEIEVTLKAKGSQRSKLDRVAAQSALALDRWDGPPTPVGPTPDPDAFHDPSYDETLRSIVRNIVAEHGPVHLDAVARQVAELHGWKRVGGRIRTRVEGACTGMESTYELNGTFLWAAPPRDTVTWRDIPGRDAAEISVAEIAGLLEAEPELLHEDDQVLALARRLGLSRLREGRRAELESVMLAGRARGAS